ncbi:MAG: hypothetical protein ACXABI_05180 [Candidatus Hodarchaeales archaeon]|jgi:hypothetical protein
MNSEDETLSTTDDVKMTSFSVNITVQTQLYSFLDKFFQLIDRSWEEFIQRELDISLNSIAEGGNPRLEGWFSEKYKELYIIEEDDE